MQRQRILIFCGVIVSCLALAQCTEGADVEDDDGGPQGTSATLSFDFTLVIADEVVDTLFIPPQYTDIAVEVTTELDVLTCYPGLSLCRLNLTPGPVTLNAVLRSPYVFDGWGRCNELFAPDPATSPRATLSLGTGDTLCELRVREEAAACSGEPFAFAPQGSTTLTVTQRGLGGPFQPVEASTAMHEGAEVPHFLIPSGAKALRIEKEDPTIGASSGLQCTWAQGANATTNFSLSIELGDPLFPRRFTTSAYTLTLEEFQTTADTTPCRTGTLTFLMEMQD